MRVCKVWTLRELNGNYKRCSSAPSPLFIKIINDATEELTSAANIIIFDIFLHRNINKWMLETFVATWGNWEKLQSTRYSLWQFPAAQSMHLYFLFIIYIFWMYIIYQDKNNSNSNQSPCVVLSIQH